MKERLLKKLANMSHVELYKAVYHDALTGVGNRRAFEDTRWTSVAIIDLDSLKYLNDTYSHQLGDQYLIRLAQLLEDVFGEDNVFRLSEKGDEFGVTSNLYVNQLILMLELARNAFPGFTYGIGYTMQDADEHLNEEKARREQCGQRSRRGEAPPWEIQTF